MVSFVEGAIIIRDILLLPFKERKMDLLFLGIVLILFVLSFAFVTLCGRI